MKEVKHFLSISDLSANEMQQVFTLAKSLKDKFKSNGAEETLLKGKSAVMFFEKPSLRTKLSFGLGVQQLGGYALYFGPEEVGIGKRESAGDIARVAASMANLIVARVNRHETLEEMARHSNVPVINALSDREHPCQALADLFTIWEARDYQDLSGLSIGYVGDGENNVTHSLCLGATMMNMDFRCASPEGFCIDRRVASIVRSNGRTIIETSDPIKAVANADVVVTDTWVSMGDNGGDERIEILRPYQVNGFLMGNAKRDALFLHCLPAYRGKEVTTEVIDGPQSVVFQEAENRLHVQKALILHILGLDKE